MGPADLVQALGVLLAHAGLDRGLLSTEGTQRQGDQRPLGSSPV